MANNPLIDQEFLKELDSCKYREIYARITLLTRLEEPIEYIEGKVTSGSLNMDGTSALRRTCTLSIVTANSDVNMYQLGLDRKFKLEIGLANTINNSYPDIIWFPQGIFVTTDFTTARSANSYSISISGKDKMCLLNGDVGGTFPSSVDLGTLEELSEDGRTVTYIDNTIDSIIRNMVEVYGNEMPYNIIINDLDSSGLELMEYVGDSTVYIFKSTETDLCTNLTLKSSTTVYVLNDYNSSTGKILDPYATTIAKIISNGRLILDQFSSLEETSDIVAQVTLVNPEEDSNAEVFTIIAAEYGDSIGYRQTDLTYAGDLIADVGDSITSILDKIVAMLGDFDYYYDIEGRFIFEKKKTYEGWSQIQGTDSAGQTIYQANKVVSDIFYSFEDNDLVVSFNNSPDLSNVKNDFSIWGAREGISGAEIDIHLRYAIDTKPKYYKTYAPGGDTSIQWTYIAGEDGTFYISDSEAHEITCDWRELIYQMALDYYKYRDIEQDFYYQVTYNNLQDNGVSYYPTGQTGYEQYYIDIMGFWRDIFAPEGFFAQVLLSESVYKKSTYYTKSNSESSDYDGNIVNRFPLYTLQTSRSYDDDLIYYKLTEGTALSVGSSGYYEWTDKDKKYFCENVTTYPNSLNFWFDFLDTTGDLGKYSVKAIGQRAKNVTNSSVTSIYYKKTPELIFVDNDEDTYTPSADDYDQKTGYTYITVSSALENCLSISPQQISAVEEMENYLDDYTYCNEEVTLTTIPVYHLKPNVRIAIKDEQTKVNGEYKINTISLSLAYNGTMSITATKIVDDVY